MRFDAKLTEAHDGWVDEPGELDLPTGLAELGEQLQADAVHLARLYPGAAGLESARNCIAQAERDEVSQRGRPGKTLILGSGISLAMLLCITAAVAINWLRPETKADAVKLNEFQGNAVDSSGDGSKRADPSVLVVTTPNRTEDDPAGHDELIGLPSYVVPVSTPITPASAHDASILNATGPQAEAYLDYIEMTSVRNVKLSF